jgi:hypothetical protein
VRTDHRHPLDWPPALIDYLGRIHGTLSAVDALGGMSAGRVWRARFERNAATVIVKRSLSPAEARFYEQAAGPLLRAGVPGPRLEWALHLADAHWLVLEDIPAPLPFQNSAGWQPDSRVVTILARLHAATRAAPPMLPDASPQTWTNATTDAALGPFEPAMAARLAPPLRRLQHESQPIFEAWCWISGDPNPLNWGRRMDGSPVLFDWELFGPGTPALDLAICLPGLGEPSQFATLASLYREIWSREHGALP